MRRRRSIAIMTSGGSRLTELRAFTVIPLGRLPSRTVTTVTPVAKWPMTLRNVSDVSSIDRSLARRVVTTRTRPDHQRWTASRLADHDVDEIGRRIGDHLTTRGRTRRP